jgi:ubiquinone/menaquinone biosynthesis C-methylase UbiE
MPHTARTHHDNVERIGGTAATADGFMARRWNRYYFRTERRTVRDMLAGEIRPGSSVLDIGTSHGNWLPFLRQVGFNTVLGVELDAGRAEQARQAGYDEVYNCDARSIPRPAESIDAAVSNDVFVHILQLEDKAAVLRETERLLRPGGVMVINHSSARAFGYTSAHVEDHCSFLTLDELIRLVRDNSSLIIEDVKPSYYSVMGRPRPRILRNLLMVLPFGGIATSLLDHYVRRRQPIDLSDYVYLKLRKSEE